MTIALVHAVIPPTEGFMFKEILQDVVDHTEGGMAGLLMGYDGIAVEQYSKDHDSFDVESVGMEYSVILKSVANAAAMLEAGDAHEVSVRTANLVTLLRMVSDEYFVAVTMSPKGNLGKARFLLRTHVDELRDALS